MQSILAALAYMPLGFFLVACWLEFVSSYKKTEENQPGVITVLFGSVAMTVLAVVASFVVPKSTPEASASEFFWPAAAPDWSGSFGIFTLALIGATYGFKVYLRNRRTSLAAAAPQMEQKALVKATKAYKDLKLGYWLCLIATALLVTFIAFSASTGRPLEQTIAFFPLGLLGSVIWLDLVSKLKSSPANHPASLSALFLTVGAALVAVAVGFVVASGNEGAEGTWIAPAWGSHWGIAAFLTIAGAYFLKFKAHRKAIAMRANSPESAAISFKAQKKAGGGALYPVAVLAALVFLGLAHLHLFSSRDEMVSALATAKETVSEKAAQGISKIKELANVRTGSATLDKFTENEGSIGSLLASSIAESEMQESSMMEGAVEEPEPMAPPTPEPPTTLGMNEAAPMVASNNMSTPPLTPEPEDPTPSMTEAPAMEPEPAEPVPAMKPEKVETEPAALSVSTIIPYDDGRFFVSKVKPILQSRCTDCHGASKKKGGLQLHTAAAIRAGGNGGAAFIAGNPDRSYLYTSTTLGEDDPDIMPAKGDPLTRQQQDILKQWILQGAHMDDGAISSSIAVTNSSGNYMVDYLASKMSPPNAAIVQALEQAEVQFRGLSGNGALVKIDYSHVPREPGKVNLKDLEPIAQNIYWLDLTRTVITEQDLAPLAKLSNLRRLELNLTGVGNGVFDHIQGLKNLEILNVYGTTVNDEGLRTLAGLKKLRKMYVWETGISPEGAGKLEKAIPGLEVVTGF